MKRINLYFIFAWLMIAILQVTVVANLRIASAIPNLVTDFLVLAIFFAKNEQTLWIMAFVTGIVLDIYNTERFGLITLTLIFITLVMLRLKKQYLRYSLSIVVILFAFFASISFDLVLMLVNGVWSGTIPLKIIGNGIYSAILEIGLLIIFNLLRLRLPEMDLQIRRAK